jgi:hypothetical protein
MFILPFLLLAACGGISEIDRDTMTRTESRLPPIDPRGGQLCVFRVQHYMLMMVAQDVWADGEFIGHLPNDSWFCVNLTPGDYIITTDGSLGFRAGANVAINARVRKFMELNADAKNLIPQTPEVGLAGIYSAMQ